MKRKQQDLTSTSEKEAHDFAHFLLSSTPFSLHFFPKRVRRALFRKRDPELLLCLQNTLQEISKKETSELLTARILALYPFLEPTDSIEVPLYIDEKWQTVLYSVERLELSPSFLGSPLTAFGLTAPSFPSLLLLMGTALPTISGHLLSLWTDFTPAAAVGELAFQLFAKKRISAWLQKQPEPVMVYGQSLGAALALHTVSAFDDKICLVHAFCPPALYKRTFRHFKGHAKVFLYWHKNDVVPLVGRGFHPLWKMYFIKSARPQSPFLAHIRVVPALSTMSVEEKMPSRKSYPFFTAIHFLLCLPIFCITSVILGIKACYMFVASAKKCAS
jgi:hypothetical protein